MSSCKFPQEILSAYADNEVDSSTQKRVEEHLSRCEACSAQLNKYRNASALFKKIARNRSNSNEFKANLERRLNKKTSIFRLRSFVAAAIVLFALSVFFYNNISMESIDSMDKKGAFKVLSMDVSNGFSVILAPKGNKNAVIWIYEEDTINEGVNKNEGRIFRGIRNSFPFNFLNSCRSCGGVSNT